MVIILHFLLIFPFSFLQSELENLAFMYTNAQDYAKVRIRISELYKEHEKELEEVIYVIL